MSKAVVDLVSQFERLTPQERSEFMSVTITPRSEPTQEAGAQGQDAQDDGADTEAALIAAQTFARLDAEEDDGIQS